MRPSGSASPPTRQLALTNRAKRKWPTEACARAVAVSTALEDRTMADIPNLAGVATGDLVETIGSGKYEARYINWSRTLHLLRQNAPGWLPEAIPGTKGLLHEAPKGAYLLIRFRHADGTVTPEVPQAVMDNTNKAIPWDSITARNVTDTHRRGVCLAAALTFGLAYELWAKVALESGYGEEAEQAAPARITPAGGVWDALDAETQTKLEQVVITVNEYMEADDPTGANEYLHRTGLTADEKVAVWSRLDSKTRTALKKATKEAA